MRKEKIIIGFAFVFFTGIIAAGCVLIWQSTIRNYCSDWQYKRAEYLNSRCDVTKLSPFAKEHCDTECYCQLGFSFSCEDMPTGVSPSFIGWGIALIVIGLFLCAGTVVVVCKKM